MSAFNGQGLPSDQGGGQLFTGLVVNCLYRGSCHAHLGGTFLLGHSFQVYEPYGFIFIHGHNYEIFFSLETPFATTSAAS